MLSTATKTVALGLLSSLILSNATAQVTCVTCPANAQASGVAPGILVTRTNGSPINPDPSSPIGACEPIMVLTDLGYRASVQGFVGAGYFGGTGQVQAFAGSTASGVPENTFNVTPADLATTKIGPAPCADTLDKAMQNLNYTLTPADIAAGAVTFRFVYSGGKQLIAPCQLNASGSIEFNVFIAPLPTCSNPGAQTICQGGSATFTTVATGTGLTYAWKKGCPGAGAVLSTTASLTINNAQVSDGGCYTVTVTDQFGCVTSCQANLTVNPTPTCSLAGATNICPGSTHTYTATILPSGGTVTYSWSISGNGTINGSTTGSSVSVTAGSAAPGQCSSFTLSMTPTRNTCPGSPCTITPTFCQPACTISPATASLCTGGSQSFTVSTSGTVGAVTISWTKNGAPFDGGSTTITAIAPAGGLTDTYVATVTDSVGCNSTCSATLTGLFCSTGITVEKDVICSLPTAACPPENDPGWAKVATGAYNPVTHEYPAFCYRFKVCNTGQIGVVIHTVTDLQPSGAQAGIDLSGCNFVGTAIPAGGCTAFCVVGPTQLSSDLTNIFTVCATPTNGTADVCAHDTNRVHLVPVGITCTKLLSVDGGAAAPADCYTLDGVNSHTLQFSVIICNSGQVPLAHVSYSDPILGVNGGDYSLAPGQCVTSNIGSLITVVCTNMENTVTVHGVVDTANSTFCAYQINGTIVDASSTCHACITCSPPASCRVTGGGKQDQAVTSHLIPSKTINVDPRANPLEAKFVTHGGQVGAPVGTATEFDPTSDKSGIGSACIKGEWEHVRHFRPGLDGNFHARHFDSIQCACLACLGDPGSGEITAGKHNQLCNAGDRFCGPEPRRAPANKICFSGVGNYTIDNGRNGKRSPNSVAFRVDIEDHGEPGGSGPKGNKRLPADRYRIRIFALSGTNPNSAANTAIRFAIRCTAGNTPLRDGTTSPLAADGVTTALGSDFNGQTPFVDDGGELDKGNHQIHPQIKNCTP
jgi:hypothetical protein